MSLLLTMLPFYVLGNLHCLGMCGPLVVMLGQHRYRYYYFLGRLLAFTLAGTTAGAIGAVLNVLLSRYHISAFASFAFGTLLAAAGFLTLLGHSFPGKKRIGKLLAKANGSLSLLILKDQPLTTFLFGLFTIALPCGQSLLVFSACALSASAWIGMLNGFCFALITSPSLFMAMRAHSLLGGAKKHYNTIMAIATIFVGVISLCRGFAEIGWLHHIGWQMTEGIHLALF